MNVRILGAAMTRFGRHADASLRSQAEDGTRLALADAGLGPGDVGMVMFANAADGVLHGQEMVRGEVALRHAGLRGVPIVNIENACASSSSAFYLACLAVEAGAADVVLVLGVEKLTHPDKARSFAAVATAVDLDAEADLRRLVTTTLLGGAGDVAGDDPVPARSPLMDLYADNARRFMDRTGATAEDFARVSVKNRRHAALNPAAQFRTPVTVDDVLASRMIADPLRLLMCAPIGDGAAGVVVVSGAYARRHGGGDVGVEACVLTSNGAHPDAARPAERAAHLAYEQAGVEPFDIAMAEVHDACSAAELWLYEEIGLCQPGDAAKLLFDGTVELGGRLPVNPSGGLLGRGHPLGATGCAQLVELVDQLRGRAGGRQDPDVRLALAQNGGGMLDDGDEAAAMVTILSRRGPERSRS
ncbi:MAG: hypothetical protein QOD57_715 [Actinomycetota bacterium]|nr:hypothetical protein [Actinomycetota bacterium]